MNMYLFSTSPFTFSSRLILSVESIFRTTTNGIDVMVGHGNGAGGGDWWFCIASSKLRFSISLPSSKMNY